MASTSSEASSSTSVLGPSTISVQTSSTFTGFSSTFSDPFPSPSSGSGSPSPSQSGFTPPAGDNLQSSASLYLYTFLATLVLLLGVSGAIVVRSLVLRRRHRRMIEEAIANGTWIPPAAGGAGAAGVRGGRVDLSKRPVMYEAYLGGGHLKEKEGAAALGGAGTWVSWDAVQPFSAMYFSDKDSAPPGPTSTAGVQSPSMNFLGAPARLYSWVPRIRMPPRRRRRNFLSPSASAQPPTPSVPLTTMRNSSAAAVGVGAADAGAVVGRAEKAEAGSELSEDGEAQRKANVAVLIAMPSQQQPEEEGEEELPHLEVGIATVCVRPGEEGKASVRGDGSTDGDGVGGDGDAEGGGGGGGRER